MTPTDTGEEEPRFRMLDVVRTFAAERLRERGEETPTRERWARHLAGLSEAAGIGLSGPDRPLWQARLDAEATDLQEAVRWAVSADRAELAVSLAAPLARWWWARGLLTQMAGIADATAELPSAAALPPGVRGPAALGAGNHADRAGPDRGGGPAARRRRGRRHARGTTPGCSATVWWVWR